MAASVASAAFPVVAICRMKEKSKSQLVPTGSVKHHFEDYCASTSIHGIKYLGEKDRPLGERLWWLFVFVACLLGNAYLIGKVWKKWNESPVIVSFAETTTPVWQVPFPAITFCSEQKSRATIFNFTEAVYMNTTDENIIKMRGDVSLVCDPHVIMDDGNYTTDESTIDFLIEVAPPMEDLNVVCKWKQNLSPNCSHLFSPVITEDGICFSFNMLSPGELFRGRGIPYYEDHGRRSDGWSLDGGYPKDSPLETYPERALAAGAKAGFFVVLKSLKKDSDYHCRGPVQGFKVLLHNPAEVPTVGERYLRAPLRQEVVVVVKPNIMTTSHGLKSYSPQGRQCYFPSERYLAHFKIYTQRNCELECITNYTLKTCGCVAIHMPRDVGVSLCAAKSKQCMIKASEVLRHFEIESTYKGQNENTCDCLPACTSLQYDYETSQADMNVEKVLSSYKDNLTEVDGWDMARLSIFFKDMQFTTSKRSELFGLVDFMANCGGLLGLFCGVSLLSLVEIIYYATLRFWSNMRSLRLKSQEDHDGHENVVPPNSQKKLF